MGTRNPTSRATRPNPRRRALLPKKFFLEKGFFPVGNNHELYFERWGNPRGVPVVFVHGGPGAGFSKSAFACFDYKKHHVLLFEQRGSNRSTPPGSIRANTTAHLVGDLEALLDHFDFKKAVLLGGSWGSTLSLVFAIRHPDRVAGLVLRGIFLNRPEDYRHFYGGGISAFFPMEFRRFISRVPPRLRKNPVPYYFRQMKSKNAARAREFRLEWARLESSLLRLHHTLRPAGKARNRWALNFSLIECHYMRNRCFLPPGYILRNVRRIRRIPLSIVHGRYDMVCPPADAHDLHKAIPTSRLIYTIAGHAGDEPETALALKNELAHQTRLLYPKRKTVSARKAR